MEINVICSDANVKINSDDQIVILLPQEDAYETLYKSEKDFISNKLESHGKNKYFKVLVDKSNPRIIHSDKLLSVLSKMRSKIKSKKVECFRLVDKQKNKLTACYILDRYDN